MAKNSKIRYVILFIATIMSTTVVSGYLNNRYVEVDGSIGEALSLPFQQTARYLKEYGEEAPDEEIAIISQVLDPEIANLYKPNISDPVKATYHGSSSEELKAYFKVWARQFFQHPMSYISATVNQNYALFWPKKEIHTYYNEVVHEDYEPSVRLAEYTGIHEFEAPWFRKMAELQEFYFNTALILPIWGMMSNIAFYNLILIFLLTFSINRRLCKTLFGMMPLLMSALIEIAAPLVCPRYSFPFMYLMPAVLALYLYEVKEKNRQEFLKE